MRFRFLPSLAALFAAMAPLAGSADEPKSVTIAQGEKVRLASGQVAHFAYHHDRNALADAVLAGDSIVALSQSGALLRFDRGSLAWKAEHFEKAAATCLGRGADASVLAGFDDGRIMQVDPATLRWS